MTPEERNLVTELFDRLATLEDAPRDPEAERAIRDGLRQAPNAVYALVQTVLVQDEALKRADARIRELEGEPAPTRRATAAFSAACATACSGAASAARGSVPSVQRAGGRALAACRRPGVHRRSGMAPPQPDRAAHAAEPARGPACGGSFLGTAAAAAAGVVGGSLLLSGIRSMMRRRHGPSARRAFDQRRRASGVSPWGGWRAAAATSRARPGSTTSAARPAAGRRRRRPRAACSTRHERCRSRRRWRRCRRRRAAISPIRRRLTAATAADD